MTRIARVADGGLDWAHPSPAERLMKKATYQDVLDAPENKVAEILDGELFLSPRPAPRHAVAHSALGALLGNAFDQGIGGPGGWWILIEPELHLGDDIVVPDVAGWRRERMPAIPDEAFFALAPDWACEVLSPSTTRIDRLRKLPIYARAGVAFAWLVDPRERIVEALRLRDGEWAIVAVHDGGEVVRLPPFEALEIELRRLWGDPPHPPAASAPVE